MKMEKQSRMHLTDELSKIMAECLKKQVFSGCSIGYFWLENETVYQENHHYGYTDRNERGTSVNKTTVFDLASLTKPLVTALAVMALVEKTKIRLKDEIGMFFSEIKSETAKVTLENLLSHSSGLPAHRPYYHDLGNLSDGERKEAIIQSICHEELVFKPGSSALYSDLGFILLGQLVEKITGESLAVFWKNEIAQPMGLQAELFFPGPDGLGSDVCAVTGKCQWSSKRLCGIVHDDNCRMLGGVAGHAGLFGTVSGVLGLAENLLLQYLGKKRHPAYSEITLREFLTRRSGSTWTCGFDTPSKGTSSSGRHFSQMTVGHLGYTGTSFWIDLTQGLAIVLLTNRVIMGDDSTQMRIFRPLLHNSIMRYLRQR